MEDKTSTLRLIYPQWQGGIVNHWMPDLPADDASRGYYLGAQLLNIIAICAITHIRTNFVYISSWTKSKISI